MSLDPPRQSRRRYASIAGLLALIAAIAVVSAWCQAESKSRTGLSVGMLVGFAVSAAIVCVRSPTLTAASIRLAVGSSLLLVSVALSLTLSTGAGWHHHSIFHWLLYWALATVVLPLLLGPGLRRIWATSGRQAWVDHLRQVPAGFLLFVLTFFLFFAIENVLNLMNRPPVVTISRYKPRPSSTSGQTGASSTP